MLDLHLNTLAKLCEEKKFYIIFTKRATGESKYNWNFFVIVGGVFKKKHTTLVRTTFCWQRSTNKFLVPSLYVLRHPVDCSLQALTCAWWDFSPPFIQKVVSEVPGSSLNFPQGNKRALNFI